MLTCVRAWTKLITAVNTEAKKMLAVNAARAKRPTRQLMALLHLTFKAVAARFIGYFLRVLHGLFFY